MKRCIRKIMITVLVFCLSILSAGCGMRAVKLTWATTGMGTVVQETLYVSNEEQGKDSIQKIEMYLQSYEEEVLSWRIETSEIARMNATAGQEDGAELTEQMEEYLRVMWEVSESSNGAFDITVGEVTCLWNLDEWATAEMSSWQSYELPTKDAIEEVLEDTGYEKITIEEGHIYLPQDMKLDLGAVGKGIVCDEISEYLSGLEYVKGAVITVGGSVLTYGSKPDGTPWQVAITHPRKDGAYLGTISLEGERYVSTSGDYERYIELDGVRYHHIMDPSTGYPADSEVCSVTIVSSSGLLSDALSTACFVLGVEEGLELAKEFGAEALFVTKELELFMTDGMEKCFKSVE